MLYMLYIHSASVWALKADFTINVNGQKYIHFKSTTAFQLGQYILRETFVSYLPLKGVYYTPTDKGIKIVYFWKVLCHKLKVKIYCTPYKSTVSGRLLTEVQLPILIFLHQYWSGLHSKNTNWQVGRNRVIQNWVYSREIPGTLLSFMPTRDTKIQVICVPSL